MENGWVKYNSGESFYLFRRVIFFYHPLFTLTDCFHYLHHCCWNCFHHLNKTASSDPKSRKKLLGTAFTFTQWFEKKLKMMKKNQNMLNVFYKCKNEKKRNYKKGKNICIYRKISGSNAIHRGKNAVYHTQRCVFVCVCECFETQKRPTMHRGGDVLFSIACIQQLFNVTTLCVDVETHMEWERWIKHKYCIVSPGAVLASEQKIEKQIISFSSAQ